MNYREICELYDLKTLKNANLRKANLGRANVWGANLRGVNFCGATIDFAQVSPKDIGGPGYILCALTEEEAEIIKRLRSK